MFLRSYLDLISGKPVDHREDNCPMKSKISLIWAVAFPVLTTSAWAADVTGTWIRKMTQTQTVFKFREEGTKLTGTVTDSHGETAISEGRIDGDEISFVVVRRSGADEIKMIYRGTVALNEIEFTCEIRALDIVSSVKFVAEREFKRNNGFVPLPTMAPVPPPPEPHERIIHIPEE